MDPRSVGIVATKSLTFAERPDGMPLVGGASLGPVTVAYETYGRLDAARSNAVLVCHALSGSAHAAGYHSDADERLGWWDNMIGPGKAIDTDRYFVVCPNILGSCYGSTGPSSIDPDTGRPYGLRFPLLTIADIVRAEAALLDHLGVPRLLAAVGGSIGGMQALEWAAAYPGRVLSVIPIASTTKRSALSIGLCEAQRQAIMADPDWRNGDYYGLEPPRKGLALARIIGHITYLSEVSMQRKFGRRLQDNAAFKYDFSTDFQVESYLHHQGRKFVDRFDANSYLYITKAADYFDLGDRWGGGSLVRAFAGTAARYLVISFSSDWLFPTAQSREMVRAMTKAGRDVSFCEIEADSGHDSFLLATGPMTGLVSGFLARVAEEEGLPCATT